MKDFKKRVFVSFCGTLMPAVSQTETPLHAMYCIGAHRWFSLHNIRKAGKNIPTLIALLMLLVRRQKLTAGFHFNHFLIRFCIKHIYHLVKRGVVQFT